ncbi:tetraspanin-16 [Callorhinchus milii]|uniref:Tetraspanin n=1 Tax=Callorhinchus milii TaxID=7868 RepID=V9KNC7_CALMI|nr:tetraspanin-16 [Callorhinchus milii]|eukprot:gi/632977428/ref/XP_007905337.1/ PREDICTED: tetraspanin-16 [Callorhinchus milii]
MLTLFQNFFACLKFLMIGINGIITVAGFVLLGFGTWVKVHTSSVLQILGSGASHFSHVGYFLIVAGCLLAFIGIIGCCAAARENKLLLLLFFIVVLTIFIGEIICVAVVLVFRSIGSCLMKEEAYSLLKHNYTGYGDENIASYGWDTAMISFHCCGMNNHTDFIGSKYQKVTQRNYPKSCCKDPKSSNCDGKDTSEAVIYQKGCLESMIAMIKRNSSVIGGVAIGIGVLELISLVISLALFINLFQKQTAITV